MPALRSAPKPPSLSAPEGASGAPPREEAFGHASDEVFRSALFEKRAGMNALKSVDHHQLSPQQSDTVDVERLGLRDLGRLREATSFRTGVHRRHA